MQPFKCISVSEAQTLCDTQDCQVIDIRDQSSYQQGHIEGAEHVGNHNLEQYLASADPSKPLIIYCYHGHSSQSAAAFFCQQGFVQVFSVDGGYGHWSMI